MCERRRRPLEGEQLFKVPVDVVQVVDVVFVKVYVVVANVTVTVVKKNRPWCDNFSESLSDEVGIPVRKLGCWIGNPGWASA